MLAQSILAATIVFSGLIVHLQTDAGTNSKRAVLVDARPTHNPVLIVADSHRVGNSGTWSILQTGTPSQPWRYDLAGTRLRVVGPTAPVTETQKYRDFVPHLRQVLTLPGTDSILPAVAAGSAHATGTSVAYLDYSGGELDVPRCHKAAAQYNPPLPGGAHCVAMQVDLRLPPLAAGATWEIQDVDDPTRKIVFKRNATVRILNDTFPPTKGQHQKHYNQLLAGQTPVRDIAESSDLECSPQCELVGILPAFGASVECTNNQWP